MANQAPRSLTWRNVLWLQARPYAVALNAVLVATLVRFALDPWVGNHAPFVLYAFAVVAAAQTGGFRAGVVATAVSVVVSDYFFVPPRYTFFLHDPRGDLIMLATFAALGLALSVIAERLRRADVRLREANALLESERRELKIANERFRMATEAANEAIWEWNLETGRATCDDSYIARFGRPVDPYDAWWFERIHPDDAERIRDSFNRALRGGNAGWHGGYQFRSADGRWVDVDDRVAIARTVAGDPIRITGAILDVTESKRTQAELEQRTRELARSNEDLQRFAFAASHDLQAPLRMIETYTQRLMALDPAPDSQVLIGSITSAITRMRTLMQDLLEFARAGSSSADDSVRCDCNAILQLALQYLSPRISETGAMIASERLPIVMANESRLLRVFQNLIANAIHYCKSRPDIKISARRDGETWVFSFKDNGIGIAPEYHERIFGLFQRLHSEREYVGSGIGLATVKRIVESSGGNIWVESEVGKGATFYFSLPAAEDSAFSRHSA